MSEEDEQIYLNTGPAFAFHPHETGYGGSHCSQNGKFCYLCFFKPRMDVGEERKKLAGGCESGYDDDDEEEEEEDWPTKIINLITTMVEEKREQIHTVEIVYQQYNKHIRPNIKTRHITTGAIREGPEWSRDTIDRHITYSPKWPTIKRDKYTNLLDSIIERHNNELIDLATKTMIEPRLDSLRKTMLAKIRWEEHRHRIDTAKAGKSISKVGRNNMF
jgi:hypothetical protein